MKKRNVRGRKKGKRNRKGAARVKRTIPSVTSRSSQRLTVFRGIGYLPFPDQYRTTLRSSFSVAVPPTQFTAANGYSIAYYCKLNACATPWNVGGFGLAPWVVAIPNQPAVTAVGPNGFRTLCNAAGTTAPYTQYRVLASTFRIRLSSQSTQDSMTILIIPVQSSNLPDLNNVFPTAVQNPMAKKMLTGTTVRNTLSHTISVSKLYGVNESVVRNSFDYASEPTVNPIKTAFWEVWLSCMEAAAPSQNLLVTLDLLQDVNFEKLSYRNLSDTS